MVSYLCTCDNPVVLDTSNRFGSHNTTEIWIFAVALPIAPSERNASQRTENRWTECQSHALSSELTTNSVRLVVSEGFVPAFVDVSKGPAYRP